MMLESILDERGDPRICYDNDITAATAVTAVRTTLGYVRFASEGHTAGTAVSGLNMYTNLIYEHLSLFSQKALCLLIVDRGLEITS